MAQENFMRDNMSDIKAQWDHYASLARVDGVQRVLDVGCHTGDVERYLAQRPGFGGRLIALDIDDARLAIARQRCEEDGLDNVSFIKGDARELPFDDASFDRVLCTETLEWVKPHRAALRELVRVLKPGGLLLVTHTDFDTVVYSGADRDLTRWVVHTFCDFADGQLGRKLWGLARGLPLAGVAPSVYVVTNTCFEEPMYGYRLAHMMVDWVTRRGMDRDDADGWLAGLEAAHSRGEYFFSINRYLLLGTK